LKGAKLDDAQAVHKAYTEHFGSNLGGRDTFEVLYQFLRHSRPQMAADPARRFLATQAIAWLSGDEIESEAAGSLGLKVSEGEPAILPDDEAIKHVLHSLTLLARLCGEPFILCIDQVENLDPEKLKPICRFLHSILDHTPNLLVITSGVKQTLLKFEAEQIIPESSWDRLAQYKVELTRVQRDEARKILEARLERFNDCFLELNAVRTAVHKDTLFPLGEDWIGLRFQDVTEARARDVVTWAREAWEEQQFGLKELGGKEWIRHWPNTVKKSPVQPRKPKPDLAGTIDQAVDGKIQEKIAQHRLQPGSLPPDAGNLAGLVEGLLKQCLGEGMPYTLKSVERGQKKGTKLPSYDLLIRERRDDGNEVTTGVLFVTNSGNSATAALRRLLEDAKPPDHRLLVTDHERKPLKVGAQGVEYYRDLDKLGAERFQHLKINFEHYAGLDALYDVVGMARSGDLEIEFTAGAPRAVTEQEVVGSHHRKDRYRSHPLLRPLLTEEPLQDISAGVTVLEKLDEKDVRQHIMAQLAWMMGSTTRAITKSYVGAVKGARLSEEKAWPQIKVIVGHMHAEGLIHATPHDDDLFLLLRK